MTLELLHRKAKTVPSTCIADAPTGGCEAKLGSVICCMCVSKMTTDRLCPVEWTVHQLLRLVCILLGAVRGMSSS